jgi:sugar-specific transcriptional regulator TrmB
MPGKSTVDDAANLIRERIRELDAERSQLERALSSLTSGREGRRGPGRPRRSTKRASGRRSGTRADQAVRLVRSNPGITASEIAKKMRIKPNYLYRVLGDLEEQGRVKKDGRKYSAA